MNLQIRLCSSHKQTITQRQPLPTQTQKKRRLRGLPHPTETLSAQATPLEATRLNLEQIARPLLNFRETMLLEDQLPHIAHIHIEHSSSERLPRLHAAASKEHGLCLFDCY